MKIEVGKYYRTRDGSKVGPMYYNERPYGLEWPWFENGGSISGNWSGVGEYGLTSDKTHPLDIVAEWGDTFFGLEKTRFTDDELERIAKAVADAVVEALRQ